LFSLEFVSFQLPAHACITSPIIGSTTTTFWTLNLQLTNEILSGRLKMRDWKMRYGQNCKGGKCRSGKSRSK